MQRQQLHRLPAPRASLYMHQPYVFIRHRLPAACSCRPLCLLYPLQGLHACVCGTRAPLAAAKCFCSETILCSIFASAAPYTPPRTGGGGRELASRLCSDSSKKYESAIILAAADVAPAAAKFRSSEHNPSITRFLYLDHYQSHISCSRSDPLLLLHLQCNNLSTRNTCDVPAAAISANTH